jgi:DNA-binding transcriptional MerR regulator
LTYVRVPSTESQEARDLGLLVVRPEVHVEPVLATLFRLYDRFEDQSRQPIRRGPDLELFSGVIQHDPSECLRPPPTQHHRVHGVHDHLLPFQAHPGNLRPPQMPPVPTYAGRVSDKAMLTIEQLAARTGMTVRNIRAHVTRGLLSPPQIRGRTGFYGPEHVARLQLIAGLQQQGFNLASIRKLVTGPAAPSAEETVAFYRTALGPWLTESPQTVTEAELSAGFGLLPDPDLLTRLRQLGVLEPAGDGRVRVLNPTVIRAGRELASMGYSADRLLDVLTVLLRQSRAVADAFVAMFLDVHWRAHVEAGMPPEQLPTLRSVIEALQPLAAQAVVAAFQQEMTQAVGRAFDRERASRETEEGRPAAG